MCGYYSQHFFHKIILKKLVKHKTANIAEKKEISEHK